MKNLFISFGAGERPGRGEGRARKDKSRADRGKSPEGSGCRFCRRGESKAGPEENRKGQVI